MKVFNLICAVILLTSAQFVCSAPELEIIENNEVPLESESKSSDDSYLVENEDGEEEAQPVENDSVNHEGDDSEDDDDSDEYYGDDDEAVDAEMLERTLGIEIPICAKHADLKYPLHTSHFTDCGKFYKCSNGRGYLFDCPAGEDWSVKLDRCDYPELAGCRLDGTHQYKLRKMSAHAAAAAAVSSDNAVVEPNEQASEDFEIDPRCDGSDPYRPVHLPHPGDCSKFYKCYMGKAYVMKCPKGQHWATRQNRCDHAVTARCSVIKIAAASLSIPYMDIDEEKSQKVHTIIDDEDYMIYDPRCIVDEDDKYNPIQFAHQSDCQMFYKCFNNFAYKVTCPMGLHYHAKKNACDYPSIAKCKSATVGIQMAKMEVHTPSIPNCLHGRNVNYGMQGSLTRYFMCKNGEVYMMECGENEFFNPNSMMCDKLSFQYANVQMQPYNSVGQNYPYYNNYYSMWNYPNWDNYPAWTNTWDRPQQQPSVPQLPPTVEQPQIVIPERPQVNHDFPSWLPELNMNINYPQFGAPQERTVDESFDFSTGKANSRCPAVDDLTNPRHLSHESDCGKFYKCFNGRAFLMDCPEEQEWSDELQRCDFHIFANCDSVELIRKRTQH